MPGKEHRYIAFTVYPGITPLDLIGPLSVLRDLKMRSPYRTCVVASRIDHMPTDTPLQMVPAHTFEEMPHPFALFVPGGPGAVDARKDESLLGYVRSAAETAEIVGATGSGALILAEAGLLQGRRATTHWAYAEQLERLGATYVQERWVEDGPFLTAAGGSAGIDLMLFLVSRLTSESVAKLTQVFVEYDPQPPFGPVRSGGATEGGGGSHETRSSTGSPPEQERRFPR